MKNVIIYFIFCIFTTSSLFAQEYTGKVFDSKTKKTLEGVSVYFDGTTLGTTTNSNGAFRIESTTTTEASLVISFLGYKTFILNREALKNRLLIYLEVEPMALEEVEIEEDNWSREKKWKYFKREFLGETAASKNCKVLNKNNIRLKYIKSEHKLYASSRKPIIIENKYLGYRVTYNLIDFEIGFNGSYKYPSVNRVFYSGTSQFEELNKKKTKKRHIKAREETYYGSVLHFMRSLASEKLAENKYQLFIKSNNKKSKQFFGISPNAVFEVKKISSNEKEVTVNKKGKIVVSYNGSDQSGITFEDEITTFRIDGFGLFNPIYKLLVSGAFGNDRISTMLPSNYGID